MKADSAVEICGARTSGGGVCLEQPVCGKARCRLHGGASTGARTKAGRKRIAAAQRKRWRAIKAALAASPAHNTRETEVAR